MADCKDQIKDLLLNRAILKQDVFENTKAQFQIFKEVVKNELDCLKSELNNDRIRLFYEEKGDYEIHAYIGSDVLVFNMHTNVFRFTDDNPLWKSSYLANNKGMGYCGVINVYNFLAESFLQGRMNDAGFLIGRVFLNKENHFMVEGKGQLGFLFRDFVNSKLTKDIWKDIVERTFIHAIEFDLISPPYEKVNVVSVMQIKSLSSSLQMKTSKRLGFKFKAEQDKII